MSRSMCLGCLWICWISSLKQTHHKIKHWNDKAEVIIALLDVTPLRWGTLEREATTHSRSYWGSPRAYQVNIQKRKKKGRSLAAYKFYRPLKKKKSPMGIRVVPRRGCLDTRGPLFLPSFSLLSWKQKLDCSFGWVVTSLKQKTEKKIKIKDCCFMWLQAWGKIKGNFKPYVLSKCQF